jgi:tol-pal system protein YbgF
VKLFIRLAALALTCSSFSFAVNKDLLELRRELVDKIDALQQNLNARLDTMGGMLQAIQSDTRRNAEQIASMQESVSTGVARSLTPVAGLGAKVDTVNDDVRSLRDSLADLSARLERMDAKMTDLKNQLQVIQNPPPAPGAAPTGQPGAPAGQPGATNAPPPGVSAERSYTDAVRDLQTGKQDLAYTEFQQYLTYFPNTELAANAQYYLGEISYNRGDYNGAIQAFDAVLERYPDNAKTPDSHLMKAMALLKSNQRTRAIQEFKTLVENYPRTDDARKAQQQLRALGVTVPAAPTSRRR